MNAPQNATTPVIESPWDKAAIPDQLTRVKIFLGIQAFFLVLSVFTGGFNFKLWSMLDTALMIQSIGVTALVVVLEEAKRPCKYNFRSKGVTFTISESEYLLPSAA